MSWNWQYLGYLALWSLLYLVGLVASIVFRNISPAMRLLIGGFVVGLLVTLLLPWVGGSGTFTEAGPLGHLLCFGLIVVGMACVFSDISDRLPADSEHREAWAKNPDLPAAVEKIHSEQVQKEHPEP